MSDGSPAPSVFTRIMRGELPGQIVYSDDAAIALLDIQPLAAGHTLVIPRRQVERLHELTDGELQSLARVVGLVARAVLSATGLSDYNVLQNNGSSAGQSVPHVHFHIIPRHEGDGLGFRWNVKSVGRDELSAIAGRIRAELETSS